MIFCILLKNQLRIFCKIKLNMVANFIIHFSFSFHQLSYLVFFEFVFYDLKSKD